MHHITPFCDEKFINFLGRGTAPHQTPPPRRPEPKKRAWRYGRAWKMKIRAWKHQDPCFNFYKHIYAILHKYPAKLIVSDTLRIAIKHECLFKNYFIVLFGCPINLI